MECKRKKVVLYNTHLGNLITQGEAALQKLQYVFSCFTNREDMVLLWRPHPLSEQTLCTMNPAFLKSYRNIEENFKKEEIGIFDDSSDLHRALAISDAYIGDVSSLVHMFSILGKPIMLLDVNIQKRDFYKDSNQKLNFLGIRTMVSIHHITYAFSSVFNGLFQVDFNEERITFLTSVPGEAAYGEGLYHSMVAVGNKLVLVPSHAEKIAVYDTVSKNLTTYFLPGRSHDNEGRYKEEVWFATGILYGTDVYLLPCHYKAIVKLDMETGQLTSDTECIKQLIALRGEGAVLQLFRKDVSVIDQVFYAVSYYSDIILSFNMETHDFQLDSLDAGRGKYNHMCFDGEHFWLASSVQSQIVRWNRQTGEKKVYCNFPEQLNLQEKSNFEDIVYHNGYIWLIPAKTNAVVRLERETGEMQFVEALTFSEEPSVQQPISWEKCWYITQDKEYLYLLSSDDYEVLQYQPSINEVKRYQFPIPWDREKFEREKETCLEFLASSLFFQECFCPSLDDFLDAIVGGRIGNYDIETKQQMKQKQQKLFTTTDGRCGERIYQYITEKWNSED